MEQSSQQRVYSLPAQCRTKGLYPQYASFVESLMRGAGETPAILKLRESVLTDRKAELCVGKLARLCPDEVGFGLGWEVVKTHGKTFLMHTGLDEGVFTLGYFDPGSRAGVISSPTAPTARGLSCRS
jgi:hypothetical protein